jgi:YD repeat-containing protein
MTDTAANRKVRVRKFVRITNGQANGAVDSKREIRNLLLFGLLIALMLTLWFRFQQNRFRFQQNRVTNFALSHLHGDATAPQSDGTYPCVFATLSDDDVPAPALGRCAVPTTPTVSLDRFEVDLRYGGFVLRQTDLQLQDVFDVPLTRAYSQIGMHNNPVHAFGRNSSHPYDIAPIGTRNPYTEIELVLEDGDFLYFKRISAGTGYADAVYQHTETSTRFYKATINWNGNGWTLRLTDGTEMSFPESYSAKNMAQGAVTEIRDASGSRVELQRDSRHNLKTIKTPHGHWIRFSYDDQSRITKAEDDRGNWVSYGYGADQDGMLLYAIHSSGRERHYEYQDRLMTTITNERGRVLLRNIYDSDKLVRQEYPNGDVYEYRYIWNARRTYYADKVIITLPDHTQKEVPVSESVWPYWKR